MVSPYIIMWTSFDASEGSATDEQDTESWSPPGPALFSIARRRREIQEARNNEPRFTRVQLLQQELELTRELERVRARTRVNQALGLLVLSRLRQLMVRRGRGRLDSDQPPAYGQPPGYDQPPSYDQPPGYSE